MNLTSNLFEYTLPPELIAQVPAEPRDHSRLEVVSKLTGQIQHSHFYQLGDFLRPGDVIVRNNSKVIPARLHGNKPTGGKVELLLNRLLSQTANSCTWECMTKPGLKPGQQVYFSNSQIVARCLPDDSPTPQQTRVIEFNTSFSRLILELEKIGSTPLPPYIDTQDSQNIKSRYQTTYAKYEGSVAAPTAGLHFTDQVEQDLRAKGISIYELTLHVGMGTFTPVKVDDITQHQMHEEVYELKEEVAAALNAAKAEGRRILAVGTTTVRVLESCAAASASPFLTPTTGSTSIFIYPGYKFKFVDGLITNFHLPKSTLLMLISAFVSSPNTTQQFSTFLNSTVGVAYTEAIKQNYRFFSFGDSMLII